MTKSEVKEYLKERAYSWKSFTEKYKEHKAYKRSRVEKFCSTEF